LQNLDGHKHKRRRIAELVNVTLDLFAIGEELQGVLRAANQFVSKKKEEGGGHGH
jgi:hypothetical protein